MLVPGLTREIRPFADWVLVGTPKTDGLIEAPDAKAAISALGALVLAVGPGRLTAEGRLIEPRVRPGMHVWPRPGAPMAAVPGNADVGLIREEDLVCEVVDEVPALSVVTS